MRNFAGKVALVTGGISGIGHAAAAMMARRGATVVIAGRSAEKGGAVAAGIGADFASLDVTQEENWRETVARIMSRHGRVDILVNGAGTVGNVAAGSLELTTLRDWRDVLATNLDGTFLGCREVMPVMKRQGAGSIINISSVGAYYPTTQSIAYGASKGAVTQLTKTVALAGAEGGCRVRCNSVHPGRIDTPMLAGIGEGRKLRPDGGGEADIRRTMARMPLGPSGTAEEAANIVVFLASDEASYMTGGEYLVDGGWRLLR
jgi:3(or 17)beta-hydroxysteroid dehydrogenase